ncbi:MAG: DUF6069 family protein [Actinomycetota bacterium]
MRFDSLLRSAGTGIVAAVIAVIIVYLIGDAVSGPLLAESPGTDGPEEVPLFGAAFSTVVGGIFGTVLALILSRLPRSVELFTGICVVILVLYGIFAFGAADDAATGVWLNLMHLAAAIPIVGSLAGWLRSR